MAKALILIAEDDTDTRALLSVLLEREGFQVMVARDGAAALRILALLQPDLIIADLLMPQVNGLELIRSVRAMPECATIPIIVFSAYTDGYLQEMKEAGATAILRKPHDFFHLSETITEVLAIHQNFRNTKASGE